MNPIMTIGLTNAVLASLLAGFLFLVSRRVRHAPLVHILWLLVLARFIMPPILPLEWRIAGASTARSSNIIPVPASHDRAVRSSQPIQNSSGNQVADKSTPQPSWFAQTIHRSHSSAFALRWDVAVGTIWIAGSVLWIIVATWRIVAFRRKLKSAAPASFEIQDMCQRLAQQFRLRSVPHVLIVADRIPPLLWGLRRRPVIVIPADLLPRLDRRQQETLLTHELAHLSRGDRWVRLLEMLVLALHWWNPVAWWASRQLRESEEACCDDWVIQKLPGSAKSYARSLLETVEFLSPQQPSLPPIASGFGSVKAFKRRLQIVLHSNSHSNITWSQRGYLTLIAAAALLFSISFVFDNPALAQRGKVGFVEVPSEGISSVSFSPDGKLLAGGSSDATVKIWDAATGVTTATLKAHKKRIQAVAFAPQGSMLASGSDDRTVILWDAKTGERLRTLEGFEDDVGQLRFSADGRTLWVASAHITSWEVETGRKQSTIKLGANNVISLDLSPDEKYLAVTFFISGKQLTAKMFDIKSSELIRNFGDPHYGVYAAAFSSDGRTLAGTCIGREEGPKLRFWNIETGEIQETFDLVDKEIWALRYSPNGKLLASGGEGPKVRTNPPGWRLTSMLTIWDPVRKDVQIRHNGASARLTSLCFSPDGKHLAYCDYATVSVIEVDSGDDVWTGKY